MELNFWSNPGIKMERIKDSMEIKSGTVIATLQNLATGTRVSLEVRGDIKVCYSPEGFSVVGYGEYYTNPVEFPKELKEIIQQGKLFEDTEHVYVCDNNWFEIFTEYRETGKQGYQYNYDVNTELCDPEGYTIPQLFDLLYDTLVEKEENV